MTSSYRAPSQSLPELPGKDSAPVMFGVGGSMGVSVRDILQGSTVIDQPNDPVFPELTAGDSLTFQASTHSCFEI